MTIFASPMNILLRLSLIMSLLWGVLGSNNGVKAQGVATDKQHDEQQVCQHDSWLGHVAEEPQTQQSPCLRTGGQSHRVVSSRNSRILPTHGGKPGQHHGRWARNSSCQPLKNSLLCLHHSHLWFRAGTASPRHYYVIALRRLLC